MSTVPDRRDEPCFLSRQGNDLRVAALSNITHRLRSEVKGIEECSELISALQKIDE